MNWLQKISQKKDLFAEFTVQTKKIGLVNISIKSSFESYDKWWKYEFGPQGWNDRQVRDKDSYNRFLNMQPDGLLYISHEFSDMMPEIKAPQRTPWEESQMDAFDIIDDEMINLENDNFTEMIKMNDLGEKIRQWFFTHRQTGSRHKDSRRVHNSEYDEVNKQISTGVSDDKRKSSSTI